jgi:hypothetical protein
MDISPRISVKFGNLAVPAVMFRPRHINSMYSWYHKAEVCYAILDDIPSPDTVDFDTKFVSSRWFTRGWTLQELLAPRRVDFFRRQSGGLWVYMGNRVSLSSLISTSTTIGKEYLGFDSSDTVREASIAQKMPWAARRQTTREEDIAYCLVGLFSVNMPLLYDEGSRAFMRLQDEIMKVSDDQTIFAWADASSVKAAACHTIIELEELKDGFYVRNATGRFLNSDNLLYEHGLLADNPAAFLHSGGYVPWEHPSKKQVPYQMTNRGLSISLHLTITHSLSRRNVRGRFTVHPGTRSGPRRQCFCRRVSYQDKGAHEPLHSRPI